MTPPWFGTEAILSESKPDGRAAPQSGRDPASPRANETKGTRIAIPNAGMQVLNS